MVNENALVSKSNAKGNVTGSRLFVFLSNTFHTLLNPDSAGWYALEPPYQRIRNQVRIRVLLAHEGVLKKPTQGLLVVAAVVGSLVLGHVQVEPHNRGKVGEPVRAKQ